MKPDRRIDWDAWEKLSSWQLTSVDGLVLLGSTAEAMLLSDQEITEMSQRIAAWQTAKPLIVGVGHASTEQVISQSKTFDDLNVAAYMVVVPYYLRPSQQGMINHFRAIADASARPVMLYNVPGRCGASLDVASIHVLARHPNIIALKDADARIERLDQIRAGVNSDFLIFSGDDAATQSLIQRGGHGVISVVSNVVPSLSQYVVQQWLNGQDDSEKSAQWRQWIQAVEVASNPIGVKGCLALMGYGSGECRPPLERMTGQQEALMRTLML